MARQVRNIHFENCQFHRNASDGLVIDPGPGFQFDNFSLTDCSFANPGWGIIFAPESDTEPEVTGSVTNVRIVSCFFQQGFLTPSCDINIGGSGHILGCDFVSHDEPDKPGALLPQIRFNALWSTAIWRVIGNHFNASPKNDHPAIDISGSKSKVAIVGNHYEAVQSVFDYPSPKVGKRPLLRFIRLIDSETSLHVIHSNIGDGQIYSEIGGNFSWLDLGPGIPVTLGSPTTKGRDMTVDFCKTFQEISFGVDLQPPLYSGVNSNPARQVDYQVQVSFQWDAGNWWISKKESKKFTINWTTPAPVDAKLDWTLHL